MSAPPGDEVVAGILASMSKGQYLLFLEAVRQCGGEIRIDANGLLQAASLPSPKVNVDATDGPVVVRLLE